MGLFKNFQNENKHTKEITEPDTSSLSQHAMILNNSSRIQTKDFNLKTICIHTVINNQM